jgi:alpha-galactosidase/6-phospho-beta-glucosidase family protein
MVKIFNLENTDNLKLTFGGTNHFFWITDMTINGEDGYRMLKEKIKD